MIRTEYEHENNTNYLVLYADQMENNNYQIKMIEKNKVQSLLPLNVRFINNTQCYYYNITSRQQMSKLYEVTKMKWTDVKELCCSISKLVKTLNEYMLDLDYILLKPEYLYMDVMTKQVYFAYYPAEEQNFYQSLQGLFEYVLEHFDHSSNKKDVLNVYELYQFIMNGETDLGRLVHDLENGTSPADIITEELNYLSDQNRDVVPDELHHSQEGMDKLANLKDGHKKCADMDAQKKTRCAYDKLAGKKIDIIPAENIIEENEQKNVRLIDVLRIIRAAGVLMLLCGMFELFFPQYSVLKLSVIVSFAFICIGAICVMQAHKRIRKNAELSSITYCSNEQPYYIPEEKEYNSIDKPNQNMDNIITTCEPDLQSNTNSEEIGNTILLSEYLLQKKEQREKNIYLVSQEDEIDQGVNSNHPIDTLDEPQCDVKKNNSNLNHTDNRKKKILIQNFPCVVGSMQGCCDIIIPNKLVSRMHLCIRQQDDGWYIEDMNSTNGTFMNGNRIKPNQQLPIADGDLLRLAAVSYKVEIS